MPYGDGTGPFGGGPVGGGMGPCGERQASWSGRCQRPGARFHRPWGRGAAGPFRVLAPEAEKAHLEQQKSRLQGALDAVDRRLEALSKENPD